MLLVEVQEVDTIVIFKKHFEQTQNRLGMDGCDQCKDRCVVKLASWSTQTLLVNEFVSVLYVPETAIT